MNNHDRNSNMDRSSLSRTIQDLTKDFTLEWGRAARRASAGVAVAADPLEEIDRGGSQGFLLTVYKGFPPGDEVCGLPWRLSDDQGTLRLGFTDRHGQVRRRRTG